MIRLANGEIDVDAIPLDDPETFAQLCLGNSIGVFQMEGRGLRDLMVAMQPSSIEDLMALISLYRPGPMGSGMDKMYVRRKHGREAIVYSHPALEEVLQETYGVILYQEDVLAVAQVLAGFDVGEADDLRKAVGKKLPEKMALYRQKFVDGCIKTHNASVLVANKVFREIEHFAGYGFVKSHAASYAVVGYQTAFLKVHYPTEFMASVLSSVVGNSSNKERVPIYLTEAKRLGVNVLSPSINHSDLGFQVLSDTEVRFGLTAIAGLGDIQVEKLLSKRERPYVSVLDFLRNTHVDITKKDSLEHLVRSGALDELVPLNELPSRSFTQEETMVMLRLERAELGAYMTKHPLEGVSYALGSQVTSSIEDLDIVPDGERVTVGGLLNQVKTKTTKAGQLMYILDLEDMTGNIEIVVFPRDAGKYKDKFHEGDIVLLDCRVSHDEDEQGNVILKLLFWAMRDPDLPADALGQPVILRFRAQPTYETVEGLARLIADNPGDSPVYFEYPDGDLLVAFRFLSTVNLDIQDKLQTLGGILNERL